MRWAPAPADIAEIIPEVHGKLPDLEPAPELELEQARFRLFDSITTFLRTSAENQPVMLVLDNLHWADPPSLQLLEFLAQELANSRLLVVGTYRDVELSRRHPLAETLGELTKDRLFQRILLRGLSETDVRRFVETAAGLTPSQSLVDAVYTQTEGNPLFVTEVVRLLVQEGGLTPEGPGGELRSIMRIPEGVREAIGRRLNRLSERCNDTLTIAAVIGREFELRQLQPLISSASSGQALSEDQLLEVLDEAVGARIVDELPQPTGRYQFSHALIRDTLADELSLTRRVRLHARIAEALEKLYEAAPDMSGYAAELAHHFSEAQEVLGTERLVKYSLIAGERASASYAYEEALDQFQRVLDAKESDQTDAEAAAALFGLGRCQAALGRIEEAIPNFAKALDYYSDTGDVVNAVAIGASPLPAWAGRLEGASALCTKALDMVDRDSLEAGRILSNHGWPLGLQEGDYQGAHTAFDRALTIARREKNVALEVATLAHAAFLDSTTCARKKAWREAPWPSSWRATLSHRFSWPSLITARRSTCSSSARPRG